MVYLFTQILDVDQYFSSSSGRPQFLYLKHWKSGNFMSCMCVVNC